MLSPRIGLAALCASLLACAAGRGADVRVIETGKSAESESARSAVAAADRAWAAAANAHDLEASVSAMAEDGIMLPPDEPPVVGRAAIKDYMARAFAIPGFRVQWDPGEIHVSSSGDMAYSYGRSYYTVPDKAGTLRTLHAKGVSIWRRQPGGRWLCVVDIWNSLPQ